MDLFSDLVQAVQDDLTVDDNSTLYPPALIKRAINRSYIKCAGLFRWPETEDAKTTSTVADQEYYDYPQTWRSDSIARLEVDDEQYGEDPDGSPLDWSDYLTWRRDEDNENSDADDKEKTASLLETVIDFVKTPFGMLAAGIGVLAMLSLVYFLKRRNKH